MQLRFGLEQQRDDAQRGAAAAEARTRLRAEGVAEDGAAEAAALAQALALERQRAEELESLIGRLRAAQFEVAGAAAQQRAADQGMRLAAPEHAR